MSQPARPDFHGQNFSRKFPEFLTFQTSCSWHSLPSLRSPFVSDTCYILRKYEWIDSTLLAVLFPQGGVDKFVSTESQNKFPHWTFLRQSGSAGRLDRAPYTWSKHPDCSQYQGDNGCIITKPIMVSGYNQSGPYPSVLAFLQDFRKRKKKKFWPPMRSAGLLWAIEQRNWTTQWQGTLNLLILCSIIYFSSGFDPSSLCLYVCVQRNTQALPLCVIDAVDSVSSGSDRWTFCWQCFDRRQNLYRCIYK